MMAALPDPEAAEVIVIQESLARAVQAQPLAAVRLTLPDPPCTGILLLVGVIEYEHDGTAPACVTVTAAPAMVSVPVRAVLEALASTRYETDPLPLPEVPDTTVIHPALLAAVQAQPAVVVTCAVAVDPPAAIFCVNGCTVKLHAPLLPNVRTKERLSE